MLFPTLAVGWGLLGGRGRSIGSPDRVWGSLLVRGVMFMRQFLAVVAAMLWIRAATWTRLQTLA
jgi:hypothetical protein